MAEDHTEVSELRAELDAMIGFTSLLRETTLTPEQAEYADTFAAVGSHLMRRAYPPGQAQH